MNKKTTKIILLALGIVVVSLVTYFLLARLETPNNSFSASQYGYNFEAEYKGSNEWEYTITGQKPSPCYRTEVEVTGDATSRTIELKELSPSEDEICAQVIEEVELTDTFSANSDANLAFNVLKLNADGSIKSGLEELKDKKTTVSSSGNFTATASYEGNNSWTYTLVGQVPSDCNTGTTEVLVAESFPEQVSIRLTIDRNGECTGEMEVFEMNGEYNASEEATLMLRVF